MADDKSEHPAWLLGLDSSTDQAGICLTNGVHTAELSWDARRDQTTALLSAVDQLLSLQRIELRQLGAVAVATGPGAFTSLRVGLSTAKGLAYACKLPLIGVPTLDGAARTVAECGIDVVAVLAAGRGRLVWASYGMCDGMWRQLQRPRNGVVDDLLAGLLEAVPRPYLVGELDEEQRAVLRRGGIDVPPATLSGRRPAGLATIAWERLKR